MNATAPRFHRPSLLRLASSAAVALLVASGGVSAQNNDDDGVLPGKGGSGSSSSVSSTAAVSLTVAGEVVGTELDAGMAQIVIDVTGDLEFVLPGESESADVDTQGMALPVEQVTSDGTGVGSIRFQGRANLNLPEGMDATMHAATGATLRRAALMIDAGSRPVDDYLDGHALPPMLDVVGDVPSLSLRQFREIVSSYGESHPGLFVTWVFVSADAQGNMRLVAVRAQTDGIGLEIHAR